MASSFKERITNLKTMDLVGNSKIMGSYLKELLTNLEALDLVETNNMSLLAITTTCTLIIVTYYWISRRHISTAKSKRREEKIWPTETRTYRVSGVPLDWDIKKLETFLACRGIAEKMAIKSLAHEANIGSQTATVTLTNSFSQNWPGRSRQFSLSDEYDDNFLFDRSISIESDFLGLTTLYQPPAKDHKIDIIALSGLGGHAFGSFKERGGTHMWLRDSLPDHLTSETNNRPMARVMIYGYESAVAHSKSMQTLDDLATTFRSSLLALAAGATTRPIILIGHSLGGLVIKQTLILLSGSTSSDDQKLIRAVYGVIFFGTPHHGMDTSSLNRMAGDGPNRFLIESISCINPQITSKLQQDFYRSLGKEGDSEVFCFYETLESPTAQQDKNGEWKMIGPTAILVTKSSATHCRSWEDGPEHICAIARTHSDMVKFGPNDHDYKNVWLTIRGLSRRAAEARNRLRTVTSKFLVSYRQNPDFIGRSDILDKIKLQFGLGQQSEHELSQPRGRVSLYGLGGVGKTQVALAYAYWIRDIHPDISVFWVHASNGDRFRTAYASIADECNVPGRENPEANILLLVKRWLEEQNKMRWLMIIDNVDDIELFFPQQKSDLLDAHQQVNKLARYIPDCNHGSILITTRNKQVGVKFDQGSPLIEVTKMTDDEAHQLVQGILKTELPKDDVLHLASKLEHLPLALAQATSFIQENTISISDYIQLLDEGDNALVDQLSESFEPVGRDSETPHAVTATWILSFRQIERTQPLASDVLCFLSLMHHQAIPQIFIEEYRRQRNSVFAQSNTSAGLIKALGILKAFSFISEGKDKVIDMHRLVHLVTRKWLINSGRMAEIVECAIRTVSSSLPFEKLDTYQACLRYIPHVNSVLVIGGTNSKAERIDRSLLLHKLSIYYHHKGEWGNEERILLQAAEIQTQELGKEHSETLFTMCDLVSVYMEQGRLKDAENLASQTIELKKKVHGQDHPATLVSMAKLALTYVNLGRLKEAEDLYLHLVETRKQVSGEVDLRTIDSMGNLVALYIQQGRLKEAENESLRTIEIRKRIFGEEHLQTIRSMSNLAMVYREQGRLKESEYWGEQAAEICKRLAGESHPHTIMCTGNLVLVYQAQGRLKEAESLCLRVVEISERVLGGEHPNTASAMCNLALSYKIQGQYEKAEDLGLRAIRIITNRLGQEHPETLMGMNNLAGVYMDQGRLNKAEDLFMQVMEMRKRTLGEEHPGISGTMVNLALVYQLQGRWKEAEDLLLQAIPALENKLGERHPNILECMTILVQVYAGQKRWKEAEELVMHVMKARKEILGEEHPDTIDATANLLLVYIPQGRWKEAEDIGVQVILATENGRGRKHPKALTLMSNLAVVYMNQGRWKEAYELGTQAMEMRKEMLGERHMDTLLSKHNVALAMKGLGRSADAIALMEECFSAQEQTLGKGHPQTVGSSSYLGKWRRMASSARYVPHRKFH